MIYFTADTHFWHTNIIWSCERPFETVEEMNETLIRNWNSRVTDKDEIYILGDFAYKIAGWQVNTILARLKGKKYLIKGNHERYLSTPEFKPEAFEWIKDYYLLVYENVKFVLSHYPMLSWDGSYHGSYHLYGHVHNSGIKNPEFGEKLKQLGPCAINVGVDVNDFHPVSITQIIEQALVNKTKLMEEQ
jgi:calcineurin-like phosphoesterase family protein